MLAVLAASAIFYWLLIVVLGVLLFYTVEREDILGATGLMILTAGLAWLIYDFNVITWSLQNINHVLYFLTGYLVAGVVWGYAKWQFFIRAAKRYLLENYTLEKIREPNFSFRFRKSTQIVPVKITDNKSRFMIWMTYWPASFVWTLIDDPIRRIFEWIYRNMAKTLQSSSDKVFSDIKISDRKEDQ